MNDFELTMPDLYFPYSQVHICIWNKNAFQYNAYRPPLDHGGHTFPVGGVPAQGLYLPRGCSCLGVV